MQAKRLVLQPRDLRLLHLLCEFGYLTLNQIETKVFACSRKKCLKRLLKLTKFELIIYNWRKDFMGIRVCRPNLAKLTGIVSEITLQRAALARNSIGARGESESHEDIVREIALTILSQNPQVALDLEHHLLGERGSLAITSAFDSESVPDILVQTLEQELISFEIELTLKSKKRYFKKLRDLNGSGIGTLIYIVKSKAIGKTVQSIYDEVVDYIMESKLNELPKLHVTELNDVTTQDFISGFLHREGTDTSGAHLLGRGQGGGRATPDLQNAG